MSLLLDALKKAALEKQKRDQESQKMGSPASAGSAASSEYKRDIFTKKISGSSATHKSTEELKPRESAADEHEQLSLESELSVEPLYKTGAESTEELVFNIEETSVFVEQNQQFLPIEEIKEDIQKEKVKSAVPIVEKAPTEKEIPIVKEVTPKKAEAAKNEEPIKNEEPTEKEALANLLESSRQTALSSAFTADGSPAPYSEQTVKAAFAQLLGRSHRAAIHQRKRLWVWLVSLSITSFFIVAGYYFFLFTTESSLEENSSFASAESTAAIEEPASQPEAIIVDTSVVESETEIAASNMKENSVIADTIVATKNKPSAQKPIAPEKKSIEAGAKAETLRTAPEPAQQQTVIYAEAALNKFSQSIETGYAAYQAGNWVQAREAYAMAMKIEPKHRDALLGSAAVAVREGRYQDALRWYQERLATDPKDAHALAGIMSLTVINSANNTQTNSEIANTELDREIKSLLREYPQAAHLYFVKGSLQAAQQQWASAQADFFEAVRLDPTNPDYSYNLAIALDHLAQSKEALNFYQKALLLSQQRAISFDSQIVSRRIADLERGAP